MLLLTALPFAAALILLSPLGRPKATRYALAGFSAALFLGYASAIPSLESGPLIETLQWLPSLGMTLTTYVDGLALLFALLVTGVGAVVAFYTANYFDDDADAQRFSVLFAVFMGSMLMVVTSGNLLMTFVGWEGTSIFSFLLIGFDGGQSGRKGDEARAGALRAFIVTGAGGLALIVGVVLLGTAAGSYELADVLAAPGLRSHGLYGAVVGLIALAAFTKSAQFPFHFWLPGAMSAPSPASAYLHAATMVKAGVFLLLRLQPALGDTTLWTTLLTVVGLITFVLGAAIATRQRDMKGLLAYTTVSALGSLVALIGLPESLGIKAALVGVAAHGAYKAALFLMTGVIEHATGSRDLDELGGLRRSMPGALAVVAISSLSMAGLPPLLGFMAKDSLIEASFPEPLASIFPLAAVMAGSILMVVSALTVLRDPFLKEPPAPHSPAGGHDDKHAGDVHHPHTNRLLTLGPAVLAAATVLIPFTLPQTLDPLLSSALGKVTHLHLFPDHPEPLILSLLALGIGIALLPSRAAWSRWFAISWIPSGSRVYSGITRSVDLIGDAAVSLQTGRVRQYLYTIWGALAVLVILMVGSQSGLTILQGVPLKLTRPGTDAVKIALLALSTTATIYSIITRRHLLAALALGVSGYALGGIFLLEPAPDVALVQILVETLGTVLIILMITRLDATNSRMRLDVMRDLWSTSAIGKARDVIIAAIIGGAVALVAVTAVISRPERSELNPPIAEWHLLHTYPEIKITDAVGAIVTDFRATDTVFEITVLAMAGLGVLTLLTQPGTGTRAKHVRNESRLDTPLTSFALRLVFPFALLVALSQLLYGGSGPGDGFTAGVIAGLSVSLSYIVRGFQRTRAAYPWLKPRRFIVAGLALALGNAVGWMLINGAPFLRVQDFGDAPAGLHFSSTLLFETAIMLAVFGTITLIMDTIAHPVAEEEEG